MVGCSSGGWWWPDKRKVERRWKKFLQTTYFRAIHQNKTYLEPPNLWSNLRVGIKNYAQIVCRFPHLKHFTHSLSLSLMNPATLLQPLLLPNQKCTFRCLILDRFLHGGVPCNSITELVSESGCGKTQLCLQLLLSAQLPLSLGGLAASSLYIHSEFPFPLRRLRQLSHSFPSLNNPLDRVFTRPVHSADQLLDVLRELEFCLSNPPKTQLSIKLVVIDSIAALFRSEFDNTPSDLKRRSSLFFKISSKLKSLANRFSLAVVVTNQVVDFMGPSDGLNGLRVGNFGCLYSSQRRVCPALGLSWANCVNTRLFLSRNEEVVGEENGLVNENGDGYVQRRTKRQIRVVFAPHLPDSSCEFVIEREGVLGVEDSNHSA